MSQGLGITPFYCLAVEASFHDSCTKKLEGVNVTGSRYNTLLLPCVRSQLLQLCGRVFACRSSNLGSIPGWDRVKYFRSTTYGKPLKEYLSKL